MHGKAHHVYMLYREGALAIGAGPVRCVRRTVHPARGRHLIPDNVVLEMRRVALRHEVDKVFVVVHRVISRRAASLDDVFSEDEARAVFSIAQAGAL